MTASTVAASRLDGARHRHVADGPVAHGGHERPPPRSAGGARSPRRASRRGGRPPARARSRSTAARAPPAGCSPRRRARSSWRSGIRARARRGHAAVEQRPQLGTLVLGVPAAGRVAEGEHALLGAGPLLVAARAAECRVEPALRSASSSTGVWSRLREAFGPVSSCTRPVAIASGTDATTSSAPSSAIRRSRNSSASGKFWPVSTCITANGIGAARRPWRRARAGRSSPCRPRTAAPGGELRGHLADDEDRLGLERLEVPAPAAGVVVSGGRGNRGELSHSCIEAKDDRQLLFWPHEQVRADEAREGWPRRLRRADARAATAGRRSTRTTSPA